jgi:gp16 family phage-associated protein
MERVEQVREQFEAEGLSIKAWAEERGYSPRTVYAVLQGSLRCKRGVSHRIAVDLGLKAQPSKKLLAR